MLAEENYLAPIDYRDLLFIYQTANSCISRAVDWLRTVLAHAHRTIRLRDTQIAKKNLATELRSLRLGEHVAENEEQLLSDYFIETASFDEVMADKTTLFIGRKGTGKTANLIRASDKLRDDKRTFVCVITPYGYQLDTVLRLLARYQERDAKGYLIESLWKFLIYSEIALAAAQEINSRPVQVMPSTPEDRLLELVAANGDTFEADFAVRLERAMDALL